MTVEMCASGYVEVRLDALKRNYAMLRTQSAPAEVGAVVKADAYGLGAQRISQFLLTQGCRRFFVATLEEGAALRSVLERDAADIYVFEGLRSGAERQYESQALRPVLNTPDQVDAWRSVAAPCAVHVDTGMNRLGMSVAEFLRLFADSPLAAEIGVSHVMTHLACADEPDSAHNVRQLEAFAAVKDCIADVEISIANSAGAFLSAPFHADVVRAGIALYGGNPFADRPNPMEPVVGLFARVLQVRQLDRAAEVGYGASCRLPAGSRIATVGVGYADGYPRSLGNRAHAAVAGVRVPVVGRVSMDLTGLDVSSLAAETPSPGEYVEMFGVDVGVDEIAEASGTISYEVLTGLNARLPRVYVD